MNMLHGKNIALIGDFEFTREEAKKWINDMGGKYSILVKQSDIIVAGQHGEYSGRWHQAKQLGKKIISESEFLKLVAA